VNTDFILNGVGQGLVGQKLMALGFNINALRPWREPNKSHPDKPELDRFYINKNGIAVPITNATLRKDEWKALDTAVLDVAQDRLVGVADLETRGLVRNIPNGLGTTVDQYEDFSDIEPAAVSMDAVTRGQNDRVEIDINSLPLPITHKDFQINIRTLNASRTLGATLDTTMTEKSTRKVGDKLEDMLFNGLSTYTFGGGTIYGYTDFPSRNTVTLTAWTTGEIALADVISMKQASIDDKYFGPWMLYIPKNYETVMDNDFKSNSDKTTRQRIKEIEGIIDVKVSDKLADSNVVLVQMTSDVVRMVKGLGITVVEWQTEGGMIFHFKVMTIQVPQLRADQEGKTGIIHAS
jgi:uncharacterized linocin/CFP29 family protein